MEQKPIDLKELSLTDLKALAYDFMVETDIAQNNLKAVNQEITLRMNTPKVDKKPKDGGDKPDPKYTQKVDHKQ